MRAGVLLSDDQPAKKFGRFLDDFGCELEHSSELEWEHLRQRLPPGDLLDIFKQKREHFDQDALDSVRPPACAEEDGRVMEAAERGISAHALKPGVVDLQAFTD